VPEVPAVTAPAAMSETLQQMAFADGDPGYEVDMDTVSDPTFNHGGMQSLSLGDFLKRPVLIDDFTWVEGSQLAHNVNPWTAFLTHPSIKNKLEHYGLMRMNLRVKFIISASPFYYGCAMITYNPKPSLHIGPSVVIGGDEQLVTYSQRPRLLLNVSESQGGEMSLPYFNNVNWLENQATLFDDMGQLRYDSFGNLENANSVAGASVNIRAYAWAENPVLSGPTIRPQGKKRMSKVKMNSVKDKITAFGLQSDEYGTGPVSGVASAVAKAGNALTSVPIIGPFARATEIGAGAVSRVAAWFGYTNVPVINNQEPVHNAPWRGTASAEIGAPIEKLTFDPKQELTIDSRTAGLDGTDEMSFQSFVTRESYIDYFDWTDTETSNDILWATQVEPQTYKVDSFRIWPTPMSHLASCFENWTGDIIYRFVVVATKYHRGRLKVSWDPFVDLVSTPDNETANITKIIDIQDTTEFEIRVPYMQARAWQEVYNYDDLGPREVFGPTGSVPRPGYQNGTLTIRVANEMTSPVVNAPVRIVVFIRGADNLTFNNPKEYPSWQWVAQGDTKMVNFKPIGDTAMMLTEADEEEDQLTLVHFGEQISSIRTMLHRSVLSMVRIAPSGGSSAYEVFNPTMNMRPPPIGTQSYSNNLNTTTTGSAAAVNYVGQHGINWFVPCFAGWRGGVNWHVSVNTRGVDVSNTYYTRSPYTGATAGAYANQFAVAPGTYVNEVAAQYTKYHDTAAGALITHTRTNQGHSVQVPFMSPYRFHSTKPSEVIVGAGNDTPYQKYEAWKMFSPYNSLAQTTVATDSSRQQWWSFYAATAPDFNVFFFTGIPTLVAFSDYN